MILPIQMVMVLQMMLTVRLRMHQLLLLSVKPVMMVMEIHLMMPLMPTVIV